MVAFGAGLVPESTSIESFYNPSGGLFLFAFGHEPVQMELFSAGVFTHRGDPAVPRLNLHFPLVETVPGALDMSTTDLHLIVGSGLKASGRPNFSLHMPNTCQQGDLTFRVKASFGGPIPVTASARYRAPCPAGTHRR